MGSELIGLGCSGVSVGAPVTTDHGLFDLADDVDALFAVPI
jgi:hypothetical protein